MANWAIVIGIDQYWVPEACLKGAVRDALAVREWLLDEDGGAVAPRNLFLLLEPSPTSKIPSGINFQQPTVDHIINAADQLIRKSGGKGEHFFFYFSGHGLTGRILRKENALAVSGFTDSHTYHSLTLPSVFDYFRATQFDHQFFFIDACRNVPWEDKEVDRLGQLPTRDRDSDLLEPEQYRLYATSDGVSAIEIGEAGNERGVFTEQLLLGLKGKGNAKAWRDDIRKYVVTPDRLFTFIKDEVIKKLEADQKATGGAKLADPSSATRFPQVPKGEGGFASPILAQFSRNPFPDESPGPPDSPEGIPPSVRDETAKQFDFLLLCSEPDDDRIATIAEALRKEGMTCERSAVPERPWPSETEEMIQKSRAVGCILGAEKDDRERYGWTGIVESAHEKNTRIVPILLPGGYDPVDLPMALRLYAPWDLRESWGKRGGLTRAIAQLTATPDKAREDGRAGGGREADGKSPPAPGTPQVLSTRIGTQPAVFRGVAEPSHIPGKFDLAQILGRWQPTEARSVPMVILTHFGADSRDSIVALSHLARHPEVLKKALPFDRVHRIDGLRSLDAADAAGLPEASGFRGCIVAAIDQFDGRACEEVAERFSDWSSQTLRRLFLLDASGVTPDHWLKPSNRESVVRFIQSLKDFCAWGAERRHRTILVGPQFLLGLPEFRNLLAACPECFVAAALFNHGRDGDPGSTPTRSTVPSMRSCLNGLLAANSHALRRAVARNRCCTTTAAPHPHDRRATEWLAELAEDLFRGGFLEPAYRIELFLRTREAEGFIPLSGDLIPGGSDQGRAKIVGFLDSMADLPRAVRHGTLVGEPGSGKTTVLRQIEHGWALPGAVAPGRCDEVWLPIYLPLDRRPDATFAEHLSDALGPRSGVGPVPRPPSPAQAVLARLSSPENLPWLFSSPLLLLFDGIQRLTEAQIGSLRKSFPSDIGAHGTLLASRNMRPLIPDARLEPAQIQLRPLDDDQIRALCQGRGRPDAIERLIGDPEQPITHEIRNPFLLSCVRDLVAQGVDVSGLDRFGVIDEFVWLATRHDEEEQRNRMYDWLVAGALVNPSGPSNSADPGELLERAQSLKIIQTSPPGAPVCFTHKLLRDYYASAALEHMIASREVAAVDSLLPAAGTREWEDDWTSLLSLLAGRLEHSAYLEVMALVAKRAPRVAAVCLRQLPEDVVEASEVARAVAAALAGNLPNGKPSARRGRMTKTREDKVLEDAEALGCLDPRIPSQGGAYESLIDLGHEADQRPLKMARYPVTNHEFARFVRDDGYSRREFWETPRGVWEWIRHERVRYPKYWHHPDLSRPNAPVVGVSLYEAAAYCRWLGGESGRPAGGEPHFRLPSGLDWLRATDVLDSELLEWFSRLGRWPDDGNAEPGPTGRFADLSEREILDQIDRLLSPHRTQMRRIEPTPIGLFQPCGSGCCDLFGGVWEWCDEWYGGQTDQLPRPGIGPFGLHFPALIRGGPAADEPHEFQSLLGSGIEPMARSHNIGFRVCSYQPD